MQSQLNGPTASVDPGAPPSERNSGQITLSTNGNTADLDSPKSDPQWQTGQSDVAYGENGRNYLSINYPSIQVTAPADYDMCRTTTGYRRNDYFAPDLTEGQYFCLKTSENRYAALKVLRLTPDRALIDVVVYDPPDK